MQRLSQVRKLYMEMRSRKLRKCSHDTSFNFQDMHPVLLRKSLDLFNLTPVLSNMNLEHVYAHGTKKRM